MQQSVNTRQYMPSEDGFPNMKLRVTVIGLLWDFQDSSLNIYIYQPFGTTKMWHKVYF